MTYEEKFYEILKDMYIGTPIHGESGYVNLMAMKTKHFKVMEKELAKSVGEKTKDFPEFKEELYERLYDFFKDYFTETGSIYYTYNELHKNTYEKVYSEDKDVSLFWKTQMLYYVKSDILYQDIEFEVDDIIYKFDVSKLGHKQNNEKRAIVYRDCKVEKDKDRKTVVFYPEYSVQGRVTKTDDILKTMHLNDIEMTEKQLNKIFKTFEKQSEVDYFINKNAKKFLRDRFDIYLYQYMFNDGERSYNEFNEVRIKQLLALKDVAYDVIDFISQFENELVRVWNKPKFVLDSNYVITKDKIWEKDNGQKVLNMLIESSGIEDQISEWKERGIVDDEFKKDDILEDRYEHLPFDTRYFQEHKLEILGLFDNLDESLDGWLIHSENYQALKTMIPKFESKVDLIYIDPPFNTGSDFAYVDKFQDSTWLSLMENRLNIAIKWLNDNGSFYLHLDYRADYLGNFLLNNLFGVDNFRNKIVWAYTGVTPTKKAFRRKYDSIFFYTKDWRNSIFNMQYIPYKALNATKKLSHSSSKESTPESMRELKSRGKELEDWWDDIYTIDRVRSEMLGFQTQKPERLLKRIIKTSSNKNSLILDYHLGSGTTIAAAQKLGRKWIGVEMGDYFYTITLPRMKRVVAGDEIGISNDDDVKWQGGGFFKYYKLEQYEDVLRKSIYRDDEHLMYNLNKSPFEQYVFLRDERLNYCMEVEEDKINVDLSKLYENIDVPETLSNLTGKWIKRITKDEVIFEDDTKIDLNNIDYRLIKPLIWWCE